jgi:hypothetical protein
MGRWGDGERGRCWVGVMTDRDVIDNGPKLFPREFLSPEHRFSVLEKSLLDMAEASLVLMRAATEMPYSDGMLVVEPRHLSDLKDVVDELLPDLQKMVKDRKSKTEIFTAILGNVDEPAPVDPYHRFRTLEIG